MPNFNKGQFSALWLPDKPADAVVSSPSVIASMGSLSDRLEVGYNHPAAIPGCVALYDFTSKAIVLYDKSGLGNDGTGISLLLSRFTDTPFGTGYKFQGAGTGDVFRTDDDTINDLTQITVEVVFEIDDSVTASWIINQFFGNGDAWGLHIQDGTIRIYDDIDGGDVIRYATPVTNNRYYHAAIQLTSGLENLFYLNGILVGEGEFSSGGLSSFAGRFFIGARDGNSEFTGTTVAVRICGRILTPSEFMHHWYLKSLVNGNFGGSSVLFDPQISTFPKRKSHLITVNWKKESKLEWATLMVNNKKSSPTSILTPNVDLTELHLGSLPIVDEHTVGYWVLDGTQASDGVSAGFVKDWSGRGHVGTLVGLSDTDLINTKFGQVYDLAGASKYLTIADHDDFSFGSFSIETAFRLNTLSADQVIICKEDGTSTREWRLIIESDGDVVLWVFETDATDNLSFTAVAGVALGVYNTVGVAHIDNGDNTSTTVIVVNGIVYTPSAVEAGTYTGMVNLGSVVQVGRRLSGSDPIDGQVFYSRVSNIARETDELIHNAMNFHRRANGIVQDSWVT